MLFACCSDNLEISTRNPSIKSQIKAWGAFKQHFYIHLTLDHTYTSCALSLWVQVGFYGSQASIFSLSATGRQGKHTVVMDCTSLPQHGSKTSQHILPKEERQVGWKANSTISPQAYIACCGNYKPLCLISDSRGGCATFLTVNMCRLLEALHKLQFCSGSSTHQQFKQTADWLF